MRQNQTGPSGAQVFSLAHLWAGERAILPFEKYGSGVRRVIDTFVAYGLPEPEFESTQGGMAVTVFKVPGGVNGGVNALLAYIEANPGKRASELAEALDTPLRTLERWLKQLKTQGLIEFKGIPKTGGYCIPPSASRPC